MSTLKGPWITLILAVAHIMILKPRPRALNLIPSTLMNMSETLGPFVNYLKPKLVGSSSGVDPYKNPYMSYSLNS